MRIIPAPSTQVYDEVQALVLAGKTAEEDFDLEMYLVKKYPDVNAQGLVPTIIRRALRDLSEEGLL